jgi:cytochrome c biogenesis protein CcmG, thiol:disulfide interchange protein DsbE
MSMKPWFNTLLGAALWSVATLLPAQTASLPTPTLSGTTLQGKPFTLAQAHGKVTLVAFWATWCPTCRAEMPTFRKFYDSNRGKGFELVTVSIDDDIKDVQEYGKLASWMISNDEQFPKLWRKDKSHSDTFGRIVGTPSSYLLNRKGELVATFRGALKPADYEKIAAAVNSPS